MKFDKRLFKPVELNCQGYEAPIMRIYDDIQTQINEQVEAHVFKAIQNVGIEVDRDELIRALNYDSRQYQDGYKRGIADAVNDFQEWLKTQIVGIDNKTKEIIVVREDRWELAIDEYKKKGAE